MNNHLNIDAYLNSAYQEYSGFNGIRPTERHSGFDSNAGVNLGFAGSGLSADGQGQGVATPMAPMKKPNPYQLNIRNTTAGDLTCVLFGHNFYLLTPNFGSATGIVVAPSQTTINYLTVLTQSASQPFETSLVRIRSANTTQVTQQISVTSFDANGQLLTIPLITENYFSAMQFQSTILDMEYDMRIDGNTSLSFTVLANASLTMTFFPSSKVNVSNIFGNAQPALQNYSAPAVAVTATPLYVKPGTLTAPMLRQ